MARARNIKPSFFKNELLGEADPLLGLLFISLWTLADKAGRLEDRPSRIKAETFPYRDNVDINRYLTQLLSLKFIERYEVDGVLIIQVVNFTKHQSPHSTEKASELPCKPTPKPITLFNASTCVNSNINVLIPDSLIPDSLIPDSLIPDSLIPDSLIPDIVSDKSSTISKKPKKQTRINALDDGFEIFWKAYPKKVGKDNCLKIWKTKKPAISDVLQTLRWQIESEQWKKQDGQFIPNPATYLNQGRWQDEKPISEFEEWLNPTQYQPTEKEIN